MYLYLQFSHMNKTPFVVDEVHGVLNTPRKRTLEEYLTLIEWENVQACLKMYEDDKHMYISAPGSSHNHQHWSGWYYDHIRDVCYLAEQFYGLLVSLGRRPDFSLGDVILTLFLHDLEKPVKYSWTEEQKQELYSFCTDENDKWWYQNFILYKAEKYGIVLSDIHLNAIKYVHGEWDDYTWNKRTQLPLAAFIHSCDTMSARMFYDYPLVGDRVRNKSNIE